jgi:hypothetical protein
VSGARHNTLEWSRFAVRIILAFSCNVALCLSKLTLYPALHSWPTNRRLLWRSLKKCAFLDFVFSVGRCSFVVLQDGIISLFGMRTVSCGVLLLVVFQGALFVIRLMLHPLFRIAVLSGLPCSCYFCLYFLNYYLQT